MEQLLHRLLTSVGQMGDENPEVKGAALLGLGTLIASTILVKTVSFIRKKRTPKPDKETVEINVRMPAGQSIKIDSN